MACLMALREDPELPSAGRRPAATALVGCPEAGGRRPAVGFCFGGMAALALARRALACPAW